MTAWKALLKKELRLGGSGFFTFLGFQLALMVLGIFLAIRYGSPNDRFMMIAVIGGILIACHYLYLLSYMVVNVFLEKKTFHLWLHNPLPSWSMLAAKLTSGLIYMTVSLLIAGVYTWVGFLMISHLITIPPEIHVYRMATFVTLSIYWVGIYNGMIIIFLWLVLHCLQSRIGKLAWPILIAGLSVIIFFLVKLTQLGFFSAITQWGRIPASIVNFWIPASTDSGFSIFTDPFYVGGFVFDLLVMAFFFLSSAWLMDHKLEMS